MRSSFPKPNIFISKCLGFANCRWNGEIIPDIFVEKLKPFVSYTTTCPECEIGLGVPRDPIRIVFKKDVYRLMQLNTGRDVTREMNEFSLDYLGSLEEIDGFILKDRSPSCGIKEVKVYPSLDSSASFKKSSGFFGKAVLNHFPHSAIETEARLTNLGIREHFLTRIFTFARFRNMSSGFKIKNLVQFHTENKFLLMMYSQKELKLMGNIVANRQKNLPQRVFKNYQEALYRALNKKPTFSAAVNVLMHGLGYFTKVLKPEEKRFFLNTLEEYRREQIPLSVPLSILHAYALRHNTSYISQQTFLEPFPRALLETRDTSKGR
ncbi:MAG: DUF523 and DUF1722 domain-containing protein [Candidatus Omnitrophica bacterium]|nr:DUF523 and DUF1722 domain-containing protein [Candidatus Omnitrophota bacterium]